MDARRAARTRVRHRDRAARSRRAQQPRPVEDRLEDADQVRGPTTAPGPCCGQRADAEAVDAVMITWRSLAGCRRTRRSSRATRHRQVLGEGQVAGDETDLGHRLRPLPGELRPTRRTCPRRGRSLRAASAASSSYRPRSDRAGRRCSRRHRQIQVVDGNDRAEPLGQPAQLDHRIDIIYSDPGSVSSQRRARAEGVSALPRKRFDIGGGTLHTWNRCPCSACRPSSLPSGARPISCSPNLLRRRAQGVLGFSERSRARPEGTVPNAPPARHPQADALRPLPALRAPRPWSARPDLADQAHREAPPTGARSISVTGTMSRSTRWTPSASGACSTRWCRWASRRSRSASPRPASPTSTSSASSSRTT